MSAVMTGYAESGITTGKFVRRRLSDGAYWYTVTPAFEAYNAAHIASYGIAAAEDGVSGVYAAADPDPATAGDYLLVKAAGASLAVSDLTAGLRWQDAAGRASASDVPTAAQVADKLLGRSHEGGADGGRTVSQCLAAARNKVAFDVPSAGSFTVYAADDVTPLFTGTYSRGANTLGPLTGVDPA